MKPTYASSHYLGDPVIIKLVEGSIRGFVRSVTFQRKGIKYSIFCDIDQTTIHNVEERFLEKGEGEKMVFEE